MSNRFQKISKFPVIIEIKAIANSMYSNIELKIVVVDEIFKSEADS